jgi:hypothetical protein
VSVDLSRKVPQVTITSLELSLHSFAAVAAIVVVTRLFVGCIPRLLGTDDLSFLVLQTSTGRLTVILVLFGNVRRPAAAVFVDQAQILVWF